MKTYFQAYQIPVRHVLRLVLSALLLVSILLGEGVMLSAQAGTQIDIHGPAGSGAFGQVTVLPNGNFVVIDPYYDAPGPVIDIGAVYLYNGATGALISTLIGSTAGDKVGCQTNHYFDPDPPCLKGITVIANGNYLIASPNWDNGEVTNAGAVTWGSSITGVNGVVSVANSLVGSSIDDAVGDSDFDGNSYVMSLSNGNYLIRIPSWDNGAAVDAGAVTWGDGAKGIFGIVSATNSLVGSSNYDSFNGLRVMPLDNGNYVVSSYDWDNGAAVNAGAVTWGNGATGVSGVISADNSLVGTKSYDFLGCCEDGVKDLKNGNYIVISSGWNNGGAANAGAVTWVNGAVGIHGVVSEANSLVGTSTDDSVGGRGALILKNKNFVVTSPDWHGMGAVTWVNGTTGISGVVSETNSLIGSNPADSTGIHELSNGNYVVVSPHSGNGTVGGVGAVTWGSGRIGVKGFVSNVNSLVGSKAGDHVGSEGITELSNGNYVVLSPSWQYGVASNAGAVTWGNGTTGVSGVVSETNSLVGSTAGDWIGCTDMENNYCYGTDLIVLKNGNYVAMSPNWHNGAAIDAGAVTWGSGVTGVKGVVSGANSLVGSSAGDMVGYPGVMALSNGNYVVMSPLWDNGTAADSGAATWGSGTTGVNGAVSVANSLVGSTDDDEVSLGGVTTLSNGNYVVASRRWHNRTGAITWGNGTTGVSGIVSALNSLVGSGAGSKFGCIDYFCDYAYVWALNNGNYVVLSPYWHNEAGAVTWGDGVRGAKGVVSSANSLVGSEGDKLGSGYITLLNNSIYVVASPLWGSHRGAATWANGESGITGYVSSLNSLVGSSSYVNVGEGVMKLSNSDYVVLSPRWNNGVSANAGAVTWGNGATGVRGSVSALNSLVGSRTDDWVGCMEVRDGYCWTKGVIELSNGNFIVKSPLWDNGTAVDTGAITLGAGAGCTTGPSIGPITTGNSVIGTAAGGGSTMNFAFDPVNNQLVVGRPADNIVSLSKSTCVCANNIYFPLIVK